MVELRAQTVREVDGGLPAQQLTCPLDRTARAIHVAGLRGKVLGRDRARP